MLQGSKFSNKFLIGLMSLGFLGTIAIVPTVGRAATPSTTSNSNSPNSSQVSRALNDDSSDINRVESSATERTPDADRTSPERENNDATRSDFNSYDNSNDGYSNAQSQNSSESSANGVGYGSTERDGAVRTPSTDQGEMNQNPSGTNDNVRSQSRTTTEPSETGSEADGAGAGMTERDGSVRTPTNNYPQVNPQNGNDTQSNNTQSDRTQNSNTQSANTSNESIEQVVENNASFSTLATAIKAAGLQDTLSGEGPYTIFAPTDEAFAAIPPETLKQLLLPENQQVLRQILSYHVVSGNIPSANIQAGQVDTVEGSAVNISTSAGNVTVSGANVVQPDIVANNGVIHAIDRVLLPPSLQR